MPSATLKRIYDQDAGVSIRCTRCGHLVFRSAGELIKQLGEHTTLADLERRMRCGVEGCSGRAYTEVVGGPAPGCEELSRGGRIDWGQR